MLASSQSPVADLPPEMGERLPPASVNARPKSEGQQMPERNAGPGLRRAGEVIEEETTRIN